MWGYLTVLLSNPAILTNLRAQYMNQENVGDSLKSKQSVWYAFCLKIVQRIFWNDSEDIRKGKLPVFPFYRHGLCSLWCFHRRLTQTCEKDDHALSKYTRGDMTTLLWCILWRIKFSISIGPLWSLPLNVWGDAVWRTNWRNLRRKDFSFKAGGSSSLPFGI